MATSNVPRMFQKGKPGLAPHADLKVGKITPSELVMTGG
jgi:hypothetical protein